VAAEEGLEVRPGDVAAICEEEHPNELELEYKQKAKRFCKATDTRLCILINS
jgi:hypothetical protein